MNGLVRNDLNMIFCRANLFSIVLLLIFFAVFSVGGMSSVAIMIPALVIARFCISLFYSDAKSNWSKFCCTLPFLRSKIVSARYLTGIIMTMLGVLVSFVYALVLVAIGNIGFHQLLFSVAYTFMASCLLIAVSFPILYKVGVEHGNTYITLITMLIFAVLLVIIQLIGGMDIRWLATVCIAFGIVIMALSYLMSVDIFQKKDIN